MGTEGKSGRMGAGMKGTMFKATSMARVNSSMPMEHFLKATFTITRYKAMVRTFCLAPKSTLVSGSTIKCTEKDI